MPIRADPLPVPVADTQCGWTKLQFRKRLLNGTAVAPRVTGSSAAAGAAPATLAAVTSKAATAATPFG